MADFPEPFIYGPKESHNQTFILLHGLGSNGKDFGEGLIAAAGSDIDAPTLPAIFPHAKFIFPTAKVRRSSAFRRSKLTQWFDIASLNDPALKSQTQHEGLADSAAHLLGILEVEIGSVGAENIVLGGISHGCAMSASLLLGLNRRIGAFVGMSGWLPFHKELNECLEPNATMGKPEDDIFASTEPEEPWQQVIAFERELLELPEEVPDHDSLSTPAFIGHGEADEKIKPRLGDELCQVLQVLGMDVTWKTYRGQGHFYKVPDQIDDMAAFLLEKVLWGRREEK